MNYLNIPYYVWGITFMTKQTLCLIKMEKVLNVKVAINCEA